MEKENQQRDRLILIQLLMGFSMREVGEKYGISKTRVAQIIDENKRLYKKMLVKKAKNYDKFVEFYIDLLLDKSTV